MVKKKQQKENTEEVINEEKNLQQEANEVELDAHEAYEKLLQESQEYFEGWQRERADFQNYKRRIEKEQDSLKKYITGEIVRKYLIILDDLELAMKNQPDDDGFQSWIHGIQLIYQKFISILEGEGVEVIPTDGEFDPNIHEAISQVDHKNVESGHIVEVMRQGYRIDDRVIRPALVIVAR